MTDKQPEALRIADELMGAAYSMPADKRGWFEDKDEGTFPHNVCTDAAAELRRLDTEVQQWQEKCNTYMELHDAVVKDSDRLYALNAELVEALKRMKLEKGFVCDCGIEESTWDLIEAVQEKINDGN